MELLSTGVEERNKGSGRKKERRDVRKMLGAYNIRGSSLQGFFSTSLKSC